MKKTSFYLLFALIFSQACAQENKQDKHFSSSSEAEQIVPEEVINMVNLDGQTIETRFLPPESFNRIAATKHSFAAYLRALPLKPPGANVQYYDGRVKANYDVYEAVVDLEIGNRDLHQCADAIMRLRAEYLWNEKRYDHIHFNFTNGFQVNYSEWMQGKRISVNGNKVSWVNRRSPSNTYHDFWKYLEIIFSYAGTLSLEKELKAVPINDLSIGDVFIHGGSPGHAIIVVDVATHTSTNEKIFLLAQSYMPAQEIQILKNPNNADISPWYSTNFGKVLRTPEWIFERLDLKRF